MIKKLAGDDGRCWLGALGIGLLLAALVPACGSSTDSPPGTAPTTPIAIESLPQKMAEAVCDNIAGCCRSANVPFELAACRANREASFQTQLSQLSRPKRSYNASGASACVAGLADFYGQCFQIESDDQIRAGCSQLFVGTVALGEACAASDECAPGADGFGHCLFVPDDPQAGGVCVAQSTSTDTTPHGKRGEACGSTCASVGGDCGGEDPAGSTSSTVCFMNEGLQCDIRTRTCQPLVALGEPCRYLGCVAGTYCTGANACATLKADGLPCDGHYECASHRCIFDYDAINGMCGHKTIATPDTCSGTSG